MRKRFLIVVGAVAVLVALTAATFAVSPFFLSPSHSILRPHNNVQQDQAFHTLPRSVQLSMPRPTHGSTYRLTLTHKSSTPSGKQSPDVALQNGADSCFIQVFAGKVGTDGLWAEGLTSCNGEVEQIQTEVYAEFCQPFLWGCYWTYQGDMGPICTVNYVWGSWCPQNGAYDTYGMNPGSLWAGSSEMCVWWLDNTGDCGIVSLQVQY